MNDTTTNNQITTDNQNNFITRETRQLKNGDIVFEDIKNGRGIIIKKGRVLDTSLISKIRENGIKQIKIRKIHNISRSVNIRLIREGMTISGPAHDDIGSLIYSADVIKKLTAIELKTLRDRGVKEVNLIRDDQSEVLFQTLQRTDKNKREEFNKKIEQSDRLYSDYDEERNFFEETEMRKKIMEETRKIENILKEHLKTAVSKEERRATIKKISDHYDRDKDVLPLIDWLRKTDYDNYISHSKVIADYAIMLGREMGMNINQMTELAYAGLVCDIGMTDINKKIVELSKSKRFSKDLILHEIRKHPLISAEKAEKLNLSQNTIRAVREHHECPDGSGYPFGLKNEDISEYAKILSIVSSYGSMTNERNYKSHTKKPTTAIVELIDLAKNGKYDRKTVNHFFRLMTLYPVATIVQLSNGEIGIVTKVNVQISFLPSVTVFMDKNKNMLEAPRVIDLKQRKLPIKKELQIEDIGIKRDSLKKVLLKNGI